MTDAVVSNPAFGHIQTIISVKFGVTLTPQQLTSLLEAQAETLKKGLLEEKIDPANLDLLVESISHEITGMHYPTETSTDYFKEYYQKTLLEKRDGFFGKW